MGAGGVAKIRPRPALAELMVSSVLQLQRELNHTRIAERGVVLAKRARGRIQTLSTQARPGERGVGHGEVRMIEKVEELGAKLEFHRFANGDDLCYVEFPLLLARTTSLQRISAQVAEESAEVRAGAGSADGKGVRPRSAEGVESGDGRAGR